MAEKERIGRTLAKSLAINGTPVAPSAGGRASVTGTLTITTPLKTISGVTVSLGVAPASGACLVSATTSGSTITIAVAKSDYTASTTATLVHWTAVGT